MPAWRPNRTIFRVFRQFFDHWWGTTSPELRVPQKTALFFQGPGFYKDCEQGVTLTEIFLKNDTLFPGALIKPTFESGFADFLSQIARTGINRA